MNFSLPILSLAMRGGDLPKSAASPRRTSALTEFTLPPKSAAVSPYRNRNLNIPAALLGFGDFSSSSDSYSDSDSDSDDDDDESYGLSLTDSKDDLDGTAAPLDRMLKDFRAAITGTGPEKNSSKAEPAYKVKYEKDAVYIKIEMPGVSKEKVKAYLDGSKLVIKGVRDSDPDLEDDKTFSARINLKLIMRKNKYKTAAMKAEMKNGVLKVMIPKIKEMEREDVVYLKVD